MKVMAFVTTPKLHLHLRFHVAFETWSEVYIHLDTKFSMLIFFVMMTYKVIVQGLLLSYTLIIYTILLHLWGRFCCVVPASGVIFLVLSFQQEGYSFKVCQLSGIFFTWICMHEVAFEKGILL